MRRREFIVLLGGMSLLSTTAQAQKPALPRIGYVGSLELSTNFLKGVRKGLAELGYSEDKNFQFELRESNFQFERQPILYRELADQGIAIILVATTTQLVAAKAVTQSIPIVFQTGVDPVESGFVASLNRPGGNLTGVANFGLALTPKRLQIMQELIPSAKKFAFLSNPKNQLLNELETRDIQSAAVSMGMNLLVLHAGNPNELQGAFESAVRAGIEAMVLGSDALFTTPQTPIVTLATRHRLPTIWGGNEPIREGGLISYGADRDEFYRLVGNYAGRILKGEKPADMPVQRSTKTMLSINLKTAQSFGITVPAPLLARADEIID